jgi:hypothetical protein
MHGAVSQLVPAQPKSFFGSEAAINQQRSQIAQQERVFRFNRLLSSHGPDAFQCVAIRIFDVFADHLRGSEILTLFVGRENAIAVPFPRQQLNLGAELSRACPIPQLDEACAGALEARD